jgi:hypothetical protein
MPAVARELVSLRAEGSTRSVGCARRLRAHKTRPGRARRATGPRLRLTRLGSRPLNPSGTHTPRRRVPLAAKAGRVPPDRRQPFSRGCQRHRRPSPRLITNRRLNPHQHPSSGGRSSPIRMSCGQPVAFPRPNPASGPSRVRQSLLARRPTARSLSALTKTRLRRRQCESHRPFPPDTGTRTRRTSRARTTARLHSRKRRRRRSVCQQASASTTNRRC